MSDGMESGRRTRMIEQAVCFLADKIAAAVKADEGTRRCGPYRAAFVCPSTYDALCVRESLLRRIGNLRYEPGREWSVSVDEHHVQVILSVEWKPEVASENA